MDSTKKNKILSINNFSSPFPSLFFCWIPFFSVRFPSLPRARPRPHPQSQRPSINYGKKNNGRIGKGRGREGGGLVHAGPPGTLAAAWRGAPAPPSGLGAA